MFRPSLGLFESSWRFWEPKCWNAQFLPLTWPWPDTWPFKKNFKSALEPSRRDLSNAASPVSLRSLVWELAWGGVIRPPPGQWRSAETPVKRGLKAIGSLSFQQDGSTPYAGKKVAGCGFHWTNRGMHHASRALLHIFSYLECCFWWVAMQEVAKSSPSTIEGYMMVINRLDVHINGQWHPSSTPHEKNSGLEAAASGAHFEHVP